MSVKIEATYDGVEVVYTRYESNTDTVVSVHKETLREAVESIVERFGQMRDECVADLERLGVRVRFETTTPESVEDRSVS